MKKYGTIFLGLMLIFVGCQHRPHIKSSLSALGNGIGEPVYFHFGQWILPAEEEGKISEKAKVLRQHPDAVVLVEGYTDSVGSEDANLELGDRRARYVRWKLSLEGVKAENLVVTSYGEGRPLSLSHDEASRQKERRVEFKVK